MWCKCGQQIPARRIEMGYRTCVKCSTEDRWSAVPVINHKTGNEIQIVKDREVAEEFMRKSARVGFGTMRGMVSSYRKPIQKETKIESISKEIPDKIVSVRTLPNRFDEVGSSMMKAIECGRFDEAKRIIIEARENRWIWGVHERQLTSILETLTKKVQ
jgi:hypothetical protein